MKKTTIKVAGTEITLVETSAMPEGQMMIIPSPPQKRFLDHRKQMEWLKKEALLVSGVTSGS